MRETHPNPQHPLHLEKAIFFQILKNIKIYSGASLEHNNVKT